MAELENIGMYRFPLLELYRDYARNVLKGQVPAGYDAVEHLFSRAVSFFPADEQVRHTALLEEVSEQVRYIRAVNLARRLSKDQVSRLRTISSILEDSI